MLGEQKKWEMGLDAVRPASELDGLELPIERFQGVVDTLLGGYLVVGGIGVGFDTTDAVRLALIPGLDTVGYLVSLGLGYE